MRSKRYFTPFTTPCDFLRWKGVEAELTTTGNGAMASFYKRFPEILLYTPVEFPLLLDSWKDGVRSARPANFLFAKKEDALNCISNLRRHGLKTTLGTTGIKKTLFRG